MALVAGTPWGSVPRPWGWEVRVDVTDDATGTIYNECLTFPAEPDAGQLAAAISDRTARIQAQIDAQTQFELESEDGEGIVV